MARAQQPEQTCHTCQTKLAILLCTARAHQCRCCLATGKLERPERQAHWWWLCCSGGLRPQPANAATATCPVSAETRPTSTVRRTGSKQSHSTRRFAEAYSTKPSDVHSHRAMREQFRIRSWSKLVSSILSVSKRTSWSDRLLIRLQVSQVSQVQLTADNHCMQNHGRNAAVPIIAIGNNCTCPTSAVLSTPCHWQLFSLAFLHQHPSP